MELCIRLEDRKNNSEIKTIPIVNLDSYPAPDPITRGMIPTTVDSPVIIIGLNLSCRS